jgi:hypothetical protein
MRTAVRSSHEACWRRAGTIAQVSASSASRSPSRTTSAYRLPLPSVRPSDEGTGNAKEVHGILALLEPSTQHSVLRDGLAVACDKCVLPSNPFKISTFPLIVLLGFVRGIWAGGRAALRKVYG